MYAERRLAFVAALAAVAAAFLPLPWPAAVLAVSGTIGLLAAFDVWRSPDPSSLRPIREAPATAEVGRPAVVRVILQNPIGRPVVVAVHDAAPASLGRTPRRHRLILPADEEAAAGSVVTPTRRGLMQLGPLTLRTAGPLGLAGRQVTLPNRGSLKVYPPLPGRAEVERRLERARTLQSGEHSSAYRGGGTEFDSLREYHPDDEFRRINWLATARAAKAISNVYREQRDQQILLLVDASRMMAGTVEDRTRFEHAMDTAHAITELATRVGDHVGMVAFGDRVVAMAGPRGGRSQSRTILDLLFHIHPSLTSPDYRGAFAALLARHRRRAMLVLLTELSEPEAMEALFAAIPALRARHLVVVGSIRDPGLIEMDRLRPAGPEEAYLKAAAAAGVEGRERTAARLRSMGVAVVDREPGALTGAIADHYLDIKARGRL